MSGSAPLSSSEITDVRRYCGYPVEAAVAYGDINTIGYSPQLDGILALLTDDQTAVVRQKLADLYVLEAAIPGASGTLNVDMAGPFKRNSAELTERLALYGQWRRELCYFLGIPAGFSVLPISPAVFIV